MSEQGSDSQMTDEQRRRLADRLAADEAATQAEEELTADRPDDGPEG